MQKCYFDEAVCEGDAEAIKYYNECSMWNDWSSVINTKNMMNFLGKKQAENFNEFSNNCAKNKC